MKKNGKFFNLSTMKVEYKELHRTSTVIRETYIDNGVYVVYSPKN